MTVGDPVVRCEFVEIDWRGRRVRIEHAWIAPTLRQAQGDRQGAAPLMVFLHEGLGSVAMWKDFPQQLESRSKF